MEEGEDVTESLLEGWLLLLLCVLWCVRLLVSRAFPFISITCASSCWLTATMDWYCSSVDCIHTHRHTHTHTHTHTGINMYTHKQYYTHTKCCTCTHMNTHTCTHTNTLWTVIHTLTWIFWWYFLCCSKRSSLSAFAQPSLSFSRHSSSKTLPWKPASSRWAAKRLLSMAVGTRTCT